MGVLEGYIEAELIAVGARISGGWEKGEHLGGGSGGGGGEGVGVLVVVVFIF